MIHFNIGWLKVFSGHFVMLLDRCLLFNKSKENCAISSCMTSESNLKASAAWFYANWKGHVIDATQIRYLIYRLYHNNFAYWVVWVSDSSLSLSLSLSLSHFPSLPPLSPSMSLSSSLPFIFFEMDCLHYVNYCHACILLNLCMYLLCLLQHKCCMYLGDVPRRLCQG